MFVSIILQFLASITLAAPLRQSDNPIEQFAQLLVNPNHCDPSSNRGLRACTDKLGLDVTNIFEVSAEDVPEFVMNTDPALVKILPSAFIDEHSIGICGRTADTCVNSLLSFSLDSHLIQDKFERQHELMARDLSCRFHVITAGIAFVGIPGLTAGGLIYAVTRSGKSAALVGIAASSLMVYLLETRSSGRRQY